MTNNLRVQLALFINSVLLVILAFGVEVTKEQIAAIMGAVNAGLYLVQLFTYQASPKRIPDSDTFGP